ncbi:MAG: intradiol ring-cleavage dioxygenase, partial [Burkholderiales bacterium]
MNSTIRRRLVLAALAVPLAPLQVFAQARAPTPACGRQTPPQTAGPFYTPSTPRRETLVEAGSKAERLILTGAVLNARCEPAARALLDFWHCDERGDYDNAGFRYRGHLYADAQGRFKLETIVPGLYPGRTRHIHVRVQAPGRRMLTTQLYFPGEPGNRGDGIWRPELEMRIA